MDMKDIEDGHEGHKESEGMLTHTLPLPFRECSSTSELPLNEFTLENICDKRDRVK